MVFPHLDVLYIVSISDIEEVSEELGVEFCESRVCVGELHSRIDKGYHWVDTETVLISGVNMWK